MRTAKKLTQEQAANICGISLRSYKQYENDISKKDTIKYNYIVNELSKIGYIDEDHGILDIDTIKEKVSNVLLEYDVDFCYLFGSYAREEANEKSDVDLLISTKTTGMALYGLAEKLRETLSKRVDLLNIDQLTNNLKLVSEILRDGIKLYGKNDQ